MTDAYAFRTGTLADTEAIVHHRAAMFADMGVGTADERAAMSGHFRPWLRAALQDGSYLAVFAHPAGQPDQVVAGAGLRILDWPPGMFYPEQRRGYLLNVYTEPEHRHRGLARRLVERCMAECSARGIGILSLHASEFGRPLYLSLGFTPTNEMRITLNP